MMEFESTEHEVLVFDKDKRAIGSIATQGGTKGTFIPTHRIFSCLKGADLRQIADRCDEIAGS